MNAPAAAKGVDAELARRRLHGLVERLHADAASGGFDYEQLRRRLVLFFRQHEPVDAEALADDALDRLARRLDEGTDIDNAGLYAFGIAKLMLFEAHERRTRREAARQEVLAEAEGEEKEEADPVLLAALRACLRELGARSAELMLAYYRDDDARRIATRRDLAAALGVSLNALRNRALRLRAALETCVRRREPGAVRDARRDGID